MAVSSSAVLFFLIFNSANCQLVGFRGVIQLPEGELYRDKETREASEAVGAFALRYQPRLKVVAQENKLVEQQRNHNKKKTEVAFFSKVGRDPSPVYYRQNEIVDFTFSRNMNPIEELRLNRKLDEIEIEKATPPSRLLPLDYHVTTPSTMLREEFRINHGPATASPPPPPKPHQAPTCAGSSCAENHIDTEALEEPRRSRFSAGRRPNPASLPSNPSISESSKPASFSSSPSSFSSFTPSLSSIYSLLGLPSSSFSYQFKNDNGQYTEDNSKYNSQYNDDNSQYIDVRPLPILTNQYTSDNSYSFTSSF